MRPRDQSVRSTPDGVSEGSPTVLCVDNDSLVREYLDTLLSRLSSADTVRTVPTSEAALSWLDRGGLDAVDCVVAEYHLHGGGVRLLRAVRDRSARVPFVFFTTGLSSVAERTVLAGGATAVVRKSTPDGGLRELVTRVDRAVLATPTVTPAADS